MGKSPSREMLRRERRRKLHPAADVFLYGPEAKRREELPVTALPEGYDGTHPDGVYVAGHHNSDEER